MIDQELVGWIAYPSPAQQERNLLHGAMGDYLRAENEHDCG